MTFKPFLFACVAILTPSVAQAQMISPMLYNGPQISLQDHANRFRSTPSQPRRSAPNAYRAVPDGDGEEAVNPAAFTYRPDLARRRANLAQFVSKTRAVDPAGADQLAKLFASGDIIEKIQGPIAPYGLHINNVADAYSTYWINAWQATRGNNDMPSRNIIAAVKAQAARALARTAEFRSASDATKQELAESLWVQAALIDGAVEQSKGKPDDLRAIGKAAAQGARGMGIDLNTMALTEEGFVPTRETGAKDPAPTGAPVGLANKGDDAAPPYMLLAALGGAGVGGAVMIGKLSSRKG